MENYSHIAVRTLCETKVQTDHHRRHHIFQNIVYTTVKICNAWY